MGLPKVPNRTPQELTQKKQQELDVESVKRFTGKSGKTRYAVQARTRSDLDQQGPTDLTAYQQQNYGLTTGKYAVQEMDSELEM